MSWTRGSSIMDVDTYFYVLPTCLNLQLYYTGLGYLFFYVVLNTSMPRCAYHSTRHVWPTMTIPPSFFSALIDVLFSVRFRTLKPRCACPSAAPRVATVQRTTLLLRGPNNVNVHVASSPNLRPLNFNATSNLVFSVILAPHFAVAICIVYAHVSPSSTVPPLFFKAKNDAIYSCVLEHFDHCHRLTSKTL